MSPNEFREIALSLPDAEERETWGEATFRVRGKIFAMMGSDGVGASIKASLDEQEIIIGSDPETFSIAPYTGRYGWVYAKLRTADPGMMSALITAAYEQTAPKTASKARSRPKARGTGKARKPRPA